MTREEKQAIISGLVDKIQQYPHFYIADTEGLNAETTAKLRRLCFDREVNMVIVKNTLFIKALEQIEKADQEIVNALKGNSAVLFSHTANAPARLIKDFRKAAEKPLLKAAYVQECIYVGEKTLDDLTNIKSREELIADVIALLQSPAKNVISALQGSAGHKVAGLVKALEERQN